MKKSLIIALLLYPLYIGFSQSSKVDSPASKSEAEIKSRIAANMDTALLNIVNAKTAVKKIVPKEKKSSPKIKTITVYVDTCLEDKTHYIFIEKVPDTIAKPEVITIDKLKWYQFKRIRERKRTNIK